MLQTRERPDHTLIDEAAQLRALVSELGSDARTEVGHHVEAVLRKVDVVERLTEEHLVRELLDGDETGRGLGQPHVVVVLQPLAGAAPDWHDLAARLRRAVPGTLCDRGDGHLRAVLPAGDLDRLDAVLDQIARDERIAAGRSEPRAGHAARGLTEATCAARVARATVSGGGARAYGTLGVYRYLAQLPPGHAPDERHATAIATLAAYDARRRTELLRTLERHLGDRGALAATARALYIHTNTLRQRLDRIETLTGLDLATEDLLSLELALKLARLHGETARA
jgi:hypothetical protein